MVLTILHGFSALPGQGGLKVEAATPCSYSQELSNLCLCLTWPFLTGFFHSEDHYPLVGCGSNLVGWKASQRYNFCIVPVPEGMWGCTVECVLHWHEDTVWKPLHGATNEGVSCLPPFDLISVKSLWKHSAAFLLKRCFFYIEDKKFELLLHFPTKSLSSIFQKAVKLELN